MKKFILKTSLFLISTSIFYLFPVIILLIGREDFSGNQSAKWQQKHPESLVGYAYGVQSFIPYKEALVKERSANVIALGSSHAMQFRKELFVNPDSFANAGGAATSLVDVKNFIEKLPNDGKERTIILNIDHEFFLKGETEVGVRKGDSAENNKLKRLAYLLLASTRKIYLDPFSKYSVKDLWNKSNSSNDIGVMAMMDKDGFRSDGSRLYKMTQNPDIKNAVKKDVEIKVDEIKNDKYDVPNDDKIIQSNLDKLSSILEMCKSRNIKVIGFMPPWPNEMYKAIEESNNTNRKLLNNTPQKISSIFNKYSFQFYNFSHTSSFSGNEDEFIDPAHGSDKMYARMILFMAENNHSLRNVIDINKIRLMIKSSKEDVFFKF